MPRALDDSEIDVIAEQVDVELEQAEIEAVGDLSDGGRVGEAMLRPMQNGQVLERGRAVVRRAWMWNGSPSDLILRWNPAGTSHDGAREQLLKRHCMCCGSGGWRGHQCPNCVKNRCLNCNVSTKREMIIANFYLRKDDVPHPVDPYGDIDCFLESCPRRGSRGYKTDQDMRMHATTRHKMQYRAYLEARTAARPDEIAVLMAKLTRLEAAEDARAQAQRSADEEAQTETVGTKAAPLYVKGS